mmetsp:Transcript_12551/g.28631  ORF Transcript_12551/g.28631 Transcript_12551/m.28631 type:complete len:260 (-) Transcript_12551:374-1153(-)
MGLNHDRESVLLGERRDDLLEEVCAHELVLPQQVLGGAKARQVNRHLEEARRSVEVGAYSLCHDRTEGLLDHRVLEDGCEICVDLLDQLGVCRADALEHAHRDVGGHLLPHVVLVVLSGDEPPVVIVFHLERDLFQGHPLARALHQRGLHVAHVTEQLLHPVVRVINHFVEPLGSSVRGLSTSGGWGHAFPVHPLLVLGPPRARLDRCLRAGAVEAGLVDDHRAVKGLLGVAQQLDRHAALCGLQVFLAEFTHRRLYAA